MKKIITLFLLLALFTSCASPAVSNTLPQSTEPITEQTKSEEQNTTDKDFVYVDYAQANRFVVFSDILLEKIKQVYSKWNADSFEDRNFAVTFEELSAVSDKFKNMYSWLKELGEVVSVDVSVELKGKTAPNGRVLKKLENIEEVEKFHNAYIYAEDTYWNLGFYKLEDFSENAEDYNYSLKDGTISFVKDGISFSVNPVFGGYQNRNYEDYIENRDPDKESFFSYLADPKTAKEAIEWFGSGEPFPYKTTLIIDNVEDYNAFVADNSQYLVYDFVSLEHLEKEGEFKEFRVHNYNPDNKIEHYSYLLEKNGIDVWWEVDLYRSPQSRQWPSDIRTYVDKEDVPGEKIETVRFEPIYRYYAQGLTMYVYYSDANLYVSNYAELPLLQGIGINTSSFTMNYEWIDGIYIYIHGSNLGFYQNDDPESFLGRILDGKLNDKNEIIDFFQTNK